MEVALIQSSASSNAIEQITAAPGRVTELVQDKTAPKDRSEEEIAGYRKVLETIHSSAENIPLTTSVVLQFHRDIYAFSPVPGGRFKSTQNEVARFDKTGRKLGVIFEGVSPLETPAAMDELHERYREAATGGSHALLLLAGAYVFDFLMIHPFNDGNGRMSRLLTLLLLYQCGHEVGRFISLEKLVEESKDTYYESLEKSTPGWDRGEHDIWPWLNYFLGILIAAYAEFEARAGDLMSGRGSKTLRIKQYVRSSTSDVFTFEAVQQAHPDISSDHIRSVLRKLRDEGIVESPGRGRKEWRRLTTAF
ncbi:MAG TPA: Fic family protein [Solirubrobacterales bacterium]|nr:Fic family protein [Solirubrobacterales bacterium]